MCVDACFTQKRCRAPHDPPLRHPTSVFVPEAEVNAVEAEVLRARSVNNSGRPRKRRTTVVHEQEDRSMPLSDAILDSCESSFKAADERRQKASTQYFEDTGLMALLCRHDQVLWLVNMHSAGEKQHYVIALLKKLFAHIPADVTVCVLYDIACQLQRSCIKWGFLSDDLLRTMFAVSCFHAYAHVAACQALNHPRKCVGCGLSDGEGCERLWSGFRPLISPLRVTGVSIIVSDCCLRSDNLLPVPQSPLHSRCTGPAPKEHVSVKACKLDCKVD